MARIKQPLKGNRLATSGLRSLAIGAFSFALFGLMAPAGPAGARKQPTADGAHMTIADPARLSGARAEEVYQAVRAQLAARYALAGDPVTLGYQNWRRYNSTPYRSAQHGNRFVNNYANAAAGGYARYEKIGKMPEGAMVAKDSFDVTESGQVLTGPFFLMEKRYQGFNPAARDWLFMMVGANGALIGITGGTGSEKVAFCGACHNTAPPEQDGLWLLPENLRRR